MRNDGYIIDNILCAHVENAYYKNRSYIYEVHDFILIAFCSI